jgi:C-terminal processing protease CtpA/Prc
MLFKFPVLRSPFAASLIFVIWLVGANFVHVKAQNPDSSAKAVNSSSNSMSAKERIEVFEEVWKAINEKYYDPKFNGVDWGAVHERYRPLVDTVKSEAEFYDLLNQMAGELRDAHTRVLSPRQQQ